MVYCRGIAVLLPRFACGCTVIDLHNTERWGARPADPGGQATIAGSDPVRLRTALPTYRPGFSIFSRRRDAQDGSKIWEMEVRCLWCAELKQECKESV